MTPRNPLLSPCSPGRSDRAPSPPVSCLGLSGQAIWPRCGGGGVRCCSAPLRFLGWLSTACGRSGLEDSRFRAGGSHGRWPGSSSIHPGRVWPCWDWPDTFFSLGWATEIGAGHSRRYWSCHWERMCSNGLRIIGEPPDCCRCWSLSGLYTGPDPCFKSGATR